MKPQEIRNLSDEELIAEEQRIRKRIFELRCQAVTEKIENPRQFTNLRRDIARLLTERSARAAAAGGARVSAAPGAAAGSGSSPTPQQAQT